MEDATSDLAKFRSQNAQHLKARSSSPVDIENFTKLQIDLVDQQRQLRELQELMDNKENDKSRRIKGPYLADGLRVKQNFLKIESSKLTFLVEVPSVIGLN